VTPCPLTGTSSRSSSMDEIIGYDNFNPVVYLAQKSLTYLSARLKICMVDFREKTSLS
jgi:hypothetical protein